MAAASPLVMRGHGGQGADVTGAEEIKVENWSQEMLNRQEMRLAKEALLESHASRFNKHFIGAAEDFEEAKLSKMSEQSRITYDTMMERHQYRMQAENILGKMVRRDRRVIFDLMRDQAEQRTKEETSATQTHAERERWLLARQIYEHMENDKRQRKREDSSKQMEDKTCEKAKKAEEETKRASDERTEQVSKNAAKQRGLAEKAKNRRLEASKAMAEERLASVNGSTMQQKKVEEAEKRRQLHQEEVTHAAHAAAQRRDLKLSKTREMDEYEFEERQQYHVDKNLTLERTKEAEQRRCRRREDSRNTDAAQRQQEEQSPPPAARGGATGGDAGEEAQKVKPKETKGPKPPSVFYYCGPETNKQLQGAHARAKRDYVQKAHQLDESREGMLLHGRFKELAESARNLGDRYEGGYTRRLRSVRNSLIRADKLAGAAGTAGASTSVSDTLADSSMQSASRAPPAMRWQSCALCDREFPGESLEGRAKRSAVLRARQQFTASKGNRRVHSARAALRHTPAGASLSMPLPASPGASASMDPVTAIGCGSATAEAPTRGPITLYDYEVWLCTACWHHMRLNT